jgi:cation diffusion facilitator family transporter
LYFALQISLLQKTAFINIKVQRWIAIISVVLFFVKIIAYYLTHSVAVLTDALESIVNIVAAFIGLYSLTISAKPRDADHPYGHGKIEYISAAIEGVLIIVAGITILYSAIQNLIIPKEIHKVDWGIILIAITAVINFLVGAWCRNIGKKNDSLALISSGSHLISDTITTVGIVVGLILFKLTGWYWVDSVVAIIVAIVILYTGYTIVKSSIEGIMDKADTELLNKVIQTLQNNRNENWIDLHNLRILKYGSILHVDAHLTVPWFFTVNEAHNEVDAIDKLIKTEYGEAVELFMHTDGCLDFSCSICSKQNCKERKNEFVKKVEWDISNVLSNEKHKV